MKKKELTERWSEALIKKYQPIIKSTKKNCYGTMTIIYDDDDIARIEATVSFKEDFEKTKNRKALAKISEERLLEEKVNDFIKSMTIKIPNREKLVRDAIWNYNQTNFNGYTVKVGDVSDDFINRIAKNYARHCLSNYEEILYKKFNGKYKAVAYQALKDKINEMVEEVLLTE